MKNIYNIDAFTTKDSAIISSMYDEFVTTKCIKKVSIKEKTNIFSKTVQKLEKDIEVIYIEESQKNGWTKILTYDGNFGYVKTNKLGEKDYKRTKMNDNDFTSNNPDSSKSIEVNKSLIKIENMQNFTERKKVIEKIIADIISKEKFTVSINLKDVDVEEKLLERFIIELLPRLKEIGGNIIILNNDVLSSKFI